MAGTSTGTLTAVCGYLKNWFATRDDMHKGTFTFDNGSAALPFLMEGQYFCVKGSRFNDGVWLYPCQTLRAETFDGAIFAMRVPQEVISLCEEIEQWQENNAEALSGPYQSESYGGYSYTKSVTSDGAAVTWQDAFAARLRRWRKI